MFKGLPHLPLPPSLSLCLTHRQIHTLKLIAEHYPSHLQHAKLAYHVIGPKSDGPIPPRPLRLQDTPIIYKFSISTQNKMKLLSATSLLSPIMKWNSQPPIKTTYSVCPCGRKCVPIALEIPNAKEKWCESVWHTRIADDSFISEKVKAKWFNWFIVQFIAYVWVKLCKG